MAVSVIHPYIGDLIVDLVAPDGSVYNLHNRTPLWYYCLKEADVTADGKRLGPVGGRIVGEVMIGLLQGDKTSYLSQDPDWTPTLGKKQGQFTMVDLLTVAGVVTEL